MLSMMRRLDFLASDDMQYDDKFCKKLTIMHAPILPHVLSMKEEQSRGRGSWKFNNSLTEDDHFDESLTLLIPRGRGQVDPPKVFPR